MWCGVMFHKAVSNVKGSSGYLNFRPCLPFVDINYFWSCYLLSVMKIFHFIGFDALTINSKFWPGCQLSGSHALLFSFLCLGIALLWDSSLWCLYISENAMKQFLLLIYIRQKRTKRNRHCFWNKGLYINQS